MNLSSTSGDDESSILSSDVKLPTHRNCKVNKTKPDYSRREILSRPTIRHLLASGLHAVKTGNDTVLTNVENMLCSSLRSTVHPFMSDEEWRIFVKKFIENHRLKSTPDPGKWINDNLDRPIFYDSYNRWRSKPDQVHNFRAILKPMASKRLNYTATECILDKPDQYKNFSTGRSKQPIKQRSEPVNRLNRKRHCFDKQIARQTARKQTIVDVTRSSQIRPPRPEEHFYLSQYTKLQKGTRTPKTIAKNIKCPNGVFPEIMQITELPIARRKSPQIQNLQQHYFKNDTLPHETLNTPTQNPNFYYETPQSETSFQKLQNQSFLSTQVGSVFLNNSLLSLPLNCLNGSDGDCSSCGSSDSVHSLNIKNKPPSPPPPTIASKEAINPPIINVLQFFKPWRYISYATGRSVSSMKLSANAILESNEYEGSTCITRLPSRTISHINQLSSDVSPQTRQSLQQCYLQNYKPPETLSHALQHSKLAYNSPQTDALPQMLQNQSPSAYRCNVLSKKLKMYTPPLRCSSVSGYDSSSYESSDYLGSSEVEEEPQKLKQNWHSIYRTRRLPVGIRSQNNILSRCNSSKKIRCNTIPIANRKSSLIQPPCLTIFRNNPQTEISPKDQQNISSSQWRNILPNSSINQNRPVQYSSMSGGDCASCDSIDSLN